MAKRRYGTTRRGGGRRGKKPLVRAMFAAAVVIVILAAVNYLFPDWRNWFDKIELKDGVLYVNYIDVGQGDGIFLSLNGETMLVDAGEREHAETVTDYIKRRGFSRIDTLVATHPHSDHIGGMTGVIGSFKIGRVLMPEAQTNTQTFENMLDAISGNNIPVSSPNPGDVFNLGGAEVTVLAPFEISGDNLNNDSIVLKVAYGDHVFLFTGDAEAEAEEQILKAGFDIDADVLKIGHHGSSSSTSEAFLQAVSPEIAVISLGKDNSYGHPHWETVASLDKAGITTYRTDIDGNIVVSADGVNLNIQTGGR